MYYQATNALPISKYGDPIILDWFNCYSYGQGVVSNRIRDDYNQPTIDKNPIVSAPLDDPYAPEIKGLEDAGVNVKSRLKISRAAPIIMPYHIILDQLREKAKGGIPVYWAAAVSLPMIDKFIISKCYMYILFEAIYCRSKQAEVSSKNTNYSLHPAHNNAKTRHQ